MGVVAIVMIILGEISAIAGTVLAAIFLLPEKKSIKLKGILKVLSDICNFRTLYIDKVVKILYVYFTLLDICVGFFLLFAGGVYSLAGLGMLLVGPALTRIGFEVFVMFILLVNNVIEINNRLRDRERDGK